MLQKVDPQFWWPVGDPGYPISIIYSWREWRHIRICDVIIRDLNLACVGIPRHYARGFVHKENSGNINVSSDAYSISASYLTVWMTIFANSIIFFLNFTCWTFSYLAICSSATSCALIDMFRLGQVKKEKKNRLASLFSQRMGRGGFYFFIFTSLHLGSPRPTVTCPPTMLPSFDAS